MHAEQGVSMGQAHSEAAIVAGGAPISPSADAALISTESNESGLWLWQGEAPPQSSLPQSKSRGQQLLRRIIPAAGWVGWIALPTGLTIILIAVSMMPQPDRPVSADAPAVALSSTSSPTVAHPSVVVPTADPTQAQLDHLPVPSAPTAKIPTRGPEPQVVKSHPQRKSSRTVKITHASQSRRGPPVLMPGVLTPPPMTWHGGGY
jgi:hypothetical protein